MSSRHFMNPQMGAHLSAQPPVPPAPVAPTDDAQQPPSGTQQSGYATPDLGPFECENCIHFQPPGTCDEPTVVSDPEVQGKVDPEGCCNLFTSAHNETQEEEHGEGKPEQSDQQSGGY